MEELKIEINGFSLYFDKDKDDQDSIVITIQNSHAYGAVIISVNDLLATTVKEIANER